MPHKGTHSTAPHANLGCGLGTRAGLMGWGQDLQRPPSSWRGREDWLPAGAGQGSVPLDTGLTLHVLLSLTWAGGILLTGSRELTALWCWVSKVRVLGRARVCMAHRPLGTAHQLASRTFHDHTDGGLMLGTGTPTLFEQAVEFLCV